MTAPPPASDPARRKGDKRERTRARLLDAALALTREKGFENTTLHEIAAHAGMTTGAIYGNFHNREALFMALGERQWPALRPRFQPGMSFAALMQATAEALIAVLPMRQETGANALAFRAYVARHAEARQRFQDTVARGYWAGADWLIANFAAEDLPMAPDLLVRTINALIEGLTFQRLLTPELIPDEVIHAAFAALAGRRTPSGASARSG